MHPKCKIIILLNSCKCVLIDLVLLRVHHEEVNRIIYQKYEFVRIINVVYLTLFHLYFNIINIII